MHNAAQTRNVAMREWRGGGIMVGPEDYAPDASAPAKSPRATEKDSRRTKLRPVLGWPIVISRLCSIACACALLAFAAAPAHALEPVRHDRWTLGLGLGLGHGEIVPPSGDSFYAKDGASHTITVLRALSPRTRAGVVWQTWLTERSDAALRVRRSMQTLTANVTLVPGSLDNAWSGFYLRGGAGIAQGRLYVAESDEHGEDLNPQKKDQTGLALEGGVGYEFRVTRHIATGMNVMANYADYGDELYDHGWYVPVSFTLNWMF
jgi:hypothetical protein